MEKLNVVVPYEQFVKGVIAEAELASIRAIVEEGNAYCSESIMAILGLMTENQKESKEICKCTNK